MSAPALCDALRSAGIQCEVEAHEGLALLRLRVSCMALADPALRRTVAGLALAHGFTHVAVELPEAAAAGR